MKSLKHCDFCEAFLLYSDSGPPGSLSPVHYSYQGSYDTVVSFIFVLLSSMADTYFTPLCMLSQHLARNSKNRMNGCDGWSGASARFCVRTRIWKMHSAFPSESNGGRFINGEIN